MDLLEPTSVNLHIREDIKKGVYVEGLQEEVVLSADDMIDLIQQGAKNRHVGSHSMNKESSRSHSVLTTIIETKSMKEGGGVWNIKTSRFHIIDLAGSERSKQTNAVGERLKEAGMINKSLSALGNVINSLVDISEGKSRHVHYRDSKLTFLLRDSLGGNSKTLIIANVSPSNSCHGETLSTLKFAQRAKLIKNKAVINEDSSGTIQILKAEIGRLKKELAENEKVMKALGNGVLGECTRCKALFEEGLEDGIHEDDEMLISFDEDQERSTEFNNSSLKKKRHLKPQVAAVLRSRVSHLESLLSANLDTLSTQQRHFEAEMAKLQLQNKRIQQTLESYEKQSSRDKMIIKFREERISKLEAGGGDQDKVVADLKKEVLLWKEAADHNTQAAKLYAEKCDLQSKLDSLKGELANSPDSLSAQIHNLTELNESLNQYLKQYCEDSQKELEREAETARQELEEQILSQQRRLSEQEAESTKLVQDLHKSHAQTVEEFKVTISEIEDRFTKERSQLIRLNGEALAQIKSESTANLYEQDRLVQELRVKLLEQGMLHEQEAKARADAEKRHGEAMHEARETKTTLEGALAHQMELVASSKQRLAQIEHSYKNKTQGLREAIVQAEERYNSLVKEFDTQGSEFEAERETLTNQLQEREEVISCLKLSFQELQVQFESQELGRLSLEDQLRLTAKQLTEEIEIRQQLEQTVSNHRSKVKMLELQSQQNLAELTDRYECQLKDLTEQNSSLKDQVRKLEQSLVAEALALKGSFESQSAEIAAQFAQLEQALKQAELSLKEQEQRYEGQVAELQKEKEIIMEEYVSELEREQAQFQQLQQGLIEQIQRERAQATAEHASLRATLEDKEGNSTRINELEAQLVAAEGSAQNAQKCYEENLNSKVEEIKDLEERLKRKEFEFKTQQDTLVSEERAHQASIGDLQSQIQELEQELQVSRIMSKEAASQLELLRSQIEELRQQKELEISSFREEQSRLIAHFEQIVERLQAERQEEDEEQATALEEQKASVQAELQSHFQLLLEQKDSEIERLQSEYNEVADQFESTIQPLQEAVGNQTKLIDVLNAKQTELVQQLATKTSELQQHKVNQAKFTAALSDSQHKLQSYHRDSTQLAEKLDHALLRNDSLLQEVEKQQHQLQSAATRTRELERAVSEHEQHYSFMQEQLSLQLAHSAEQYEAEILRLREEAATEKDGSISAMQALEERIDGLLTELDEAHSQHAKQVAVLKEQVSEKLSSNEIEMRLHSAEKRHEAHTEDMQKAHQEEIQKYEDRFKELSADLEARTHSISDSAQKVTKLKRQVHEHEEMLKSCKDIISMMRAREEQVEQDMKLKQSQLIEREEKVKRQLREYKDERDRLLQESAALKELVRHKDRQLDDWMHAEERDKQALERISKDNKDLRSQVQKHKFEMSDLAKKLKWYLDETARLKIDNEKLAKENDQLVGHKNPSQKIQHHVRIKEENNRLREENIKLQDELRRYIEMQAVFREQDDDSHLVAFVLGQQTLLRCVGLTVEQVAHCSREERTEIAGNLVGSMVSLANEREQRIKDLERDVKKFESLLSVSERERVLQRDTTVQSPIPPMSIAPLSVKSQAGKENLLKRPLQKKESVSKLVGHHVRSGSARPR